MTMIEVARHEDQQGLLAVPASGDEDLDCLIDDVDPFTCSTGHLRMLQDAAIASSIKLLVAGKPRCAARPDRLCAWLAAVAHTRRRWTDAILCEMQPAHALAVVEGWADAADQVDQRHAAHNLWQRGATRKQIAHNARKRVAARAGERAALAHLRLGLTAARLI